MTNTETRTADFHMKFGHPVRFVSATLTRDEAILTLGLIEEELRELAEAMFPDLPYDPECKSMSEVLELYPYDYAYEPDLVAIADAVADLDVVVNGAGIRHGFDMDALGREVYESNMSKLGEDGKPIYKPNGKIAKGPNFREPNIARALGISE